MIFISYRISDSLDLVGRLDADLVSLYGRSAVFRDKSRLHGGSDWPSTIEQAVRTCQAVLVVIGATWQSASFADGDWKGVPRLWHPDDWVRKEIALAINDDKVVIPVLLNDAALPAEGWLQRCSLGDLHRRQTIPLRTNEYEADFRGLIGVLRLHCPELTGEAAGKTAGRLNEAGDSARRAVKSVEPSWISFEPSPVEHWSARRRQPWSQTTDTLDLTLPLEDREDAIALPGHSASRMRVYGFSSEAVEAFQVAFGEAIGNAFEHGCTTGRDIVTIRLNVTEHYSSFAVCNPSSRPFDLQLALQNAEAQLSRAPRSRRGRGLILMRDLCDQLSSVESNLGVKGVVHRSRVIYSVTHIDDLAVATLISGVWNDSLPRRTSKLVGDESQRNILLDFSAWSTGGTVLHRVILDAEGILSSSAKRVVALLYKPRNKSESPIDLPNELVAYEVPAAVLALGRPDLLSQVERAVLVANLRLE